jgi:EAL domain-containing protein (putative c-di-GMP-specific phosphodiesterase class I)
MPFNMSNQEVFITVSVGIALSTPDYDKPEDLLRDADTAMYRAKARGRSNYEVFDRQMHDQVMQRLQLETDLHRSLARDDFLLYYQPIVALNQTEGQASDGVKAGTEIETKADVEAGSEFDVAPLADLLAASGTTLSGFEALVRWQRPHCGFTVPDDFIALAEETGLIVPLDRWVLEAACVQMQAWRQRFPAWSHLTMSVNLSSRQFSQPDFVAFVNDVLARTELPAGNLNLEITESAIIENLESVMTILHALRERGVRVSIDDFGTGYSSLTYLNRLPLNTLKVDRSFVAQMSGEPENLAVVRAIVTLAHSLNMEVVAEGVEARTQLEQFRGLCCEYAQGHLFAPAMEVKTAEVLLARNPPQ